MIQLTEAINIVKPVAQQCGLTNKEVIALLEEAIDDVDLLSKEVLSAPEALYEACLIGEIQGKLQVALETLKKPK